MNMHRFALFTAVITFGSHAQASIFFTDSFEGQFVGTFDGMPVNGNLLDRVGSPNTYPLALLDAYQGIRMFNDAQPYYQWDRGPYPDVAPFSGVSASVWRPEGGLATITLLGSGNALYKAGRVGVWTNFLPGQHRIEVYGKIFGEFPESDSYIGELTFTVPDDPTNQYADYHFVGVQSDNYAITRLNFWADSGPQVFNFDNVTYDPVPEPATLAVLGLGAALLNRRRK